jgi:hypothetical protein
MENPGTTAHERKKGQRNVGHGNKTKVMSLIPLPIIPLPMDFGLNFFFSTAIQCKWVQFTSVAPEPGFCFLPGTWMERT